MKSLEDWHQKGRELMGARKPRSGMELDERFDQVTNDAFNAYLIGKQLSSHTSQILIPPITVFYAAGSEPLLENAWAVIDHAFPEQVSDKFFIRREPIE